LLLSLQNDLRVEQPPVLTPPIFHIIRIAHKLNQKAGRYLQQQAMPSTRRTFNELIGIRLNSEAPLQVMVMMDAGNHAGVSTWSSHRHQSRGALTRKDSFMADVKLHLIDSSVSFERVMWKLNGLFFYQEIN
jgi:hypothetical protein